jgi:DNA-directed RNA polymerase specialized sigma24 family protein
MTEKEKTLIAGCLKGEKAAGDAFVLQYFSLVYHTIRKTLTVHHIEARDEAMEDLYQEFFVSLIQDDCKKLCQSEREHGCRLAG